MMRRVFATAGCSSMRFTPPTRLGVSPWPPSSFLHHGSSQRFKHHHAHASSARGRVKPLFDFVKSNWFTMSLPFMVLFSQQYPDVMRNGGMVSFEKWKDFCVAGIFLASGLAIPVAQMGAVIRMWRVHSLIQASIFLLAPLLFMGSAPLLTAAGLPEKIVLGWVILGCLPTSIGVTLALTRISGGDTATTLLNSALSNIVGVFVTPLVCLWATGLQPAIDAVDVIRKLMLVVALPSIVGMLLRHRIARLATMDAYWKLMQPLCLLPVLFNVFSNAFSDSAAGVLTANQFATLLAFAVLMNLGLMSANFALSGPVPAITGQARAAAVFCGAQKTAAMGVPMMSMMFAGDPQLALLTMPLLCYHPVQASVGGMYATWLRRRLALH